MRKLNYTKAMTILEKVRSDEEEDEAVKKKRCRRVRIQRDDDLRNEIIDYDGD